MYSRRNAFTLVELLVVMAILALLLGILMPALAAAVEAGRTSKCASNLRQFGNALKLYLKHSNGQLPPFRLPKNADDTNPLVDVGNGRKVRPRVAAMLANYLEHAFENPSTTDERQSYDSPVMSCPSVPQWVDERNFAYGYNYQFLGNSRNKSGSTTEFINWPVPEGAVTKPTRTIVMGDCMGTAAAYPKSQRQVYQLRGTEVRALGNHALTVDPPYLASHDGNNVVTAAPEVNGARSALDPRHSGRANVLFFDGHVEAMTMQQAGYEVLSDGSVTHGYRLGLGNEVQITGDNRLWSGDYTNKAPPLAN